MFLVVKKESLQKMQLGTVIQVSNGTNVQVKIKKLMDILVMERFGKKQEALQPTP